MKSISFAIGAIRKQQQRPDKISITAYLDRKHGLSILAMTRTIDYMLDSAAFYCKPRNGKDSYYIFDPLKVCDSAEKITGSEIDFAQNVEPNHADASINTTPFSSPAMQSMKKDPGTSIDSAFGVLDVMGKFADAIKGLNKLLSKEKERNEILEANLNSKLAENYDLNLRFKF